MRTLTKVLCTSVWLHLVAAMVHGQPVTTRIDSLQWMAAASVSIVRGTIETIVPLNPDDSHVRFYEVSVKVQETLLGTARNQICFVTSSEGPIVELKTSGHHGLLFLTGSQTDFNRQTNEYFCTRCPLICRNLIDLDAKTATIASWGKNGLNRISGRDVILTEVKDHVSRFRRGERVHQFALREPTPSTFAGYDTHISVPVDQQLWAIAQLWSQSGGTKEGAGKEIKNAFVPILEYEQAKAKYSAAQQAPTPRRPVNSLSIDSVEWMTADSDLIVRGTIEDLALLQLADSDNRDDYCSTLDIHFVKLRVHETVKGKANGFVSFVVENGGELSKWQQQKIPLLVFLKDHLIQGLDPPMRLRAGTDCGQYQVLRYAGRGPGREAIIAFEKPHPVIFSARLTWLDDAGEMMKVVGQYLSEIPASREAGTRRVQSFSFQPRESFTAGTSWQGDRYARIKFPIDSYLEKQARRWILSDEQEHRWLGAAALAYFKLDENAKVLERLLNDPGKWRTPILVSIYSDLKVEYLVRWEAWTILNAWGYGVAKPAFLD